MKRLVAILIIILALIGGAGYFVYQQQQSDKSSESSSSTNESTDSTKSKTNNEEQTKFSLIDPTSQWVVVNKTRPLSPAAYMPDDLVVPPIKLRSNITMEERQVRRVTADALKLLADAATADGLTLTLESGFRSYAFQKNLYNQYVIEQTQAVADTQSARAGYSEHQTGLAADVGGTSIPACNVGSCFADTKEGKWVALNAHKYGFVIRYPDNKTAVTGYKYEPWHLRYVGTELASEMHTKGIQSMEEYFGLPAAPDYK